MRSLSSRIGGVLSLNGPSGGGGAGPASGDGGLGSSAASKRHSVGVALTTYATLPSEPSPVEVTTRPKGVVTHVTVAPELEAEGEDDGDDDALEAAGGGDGASLKWQWQRRVYAWLQRKIRAINEEPVVYFAKDGHLPTLNKAVQYVRDNELSAHLWVVHVVDDRAAVLALKAEQDAAAGGGGADAADVSAASVAGATPPSTPPTLRISSSFHAPVSASDVNTVSSLLDRLPPPSPQVQAIIDNCALLDAVYPKLRIDCMVVRGTYFSPAVVRFLRSRLRVEPNMMFMAMPDVRFPHQFAALGGVRVITAPPRRRDREHGASQLLDVLRTATAHAAAASSHDDGRDGGMDGAGTGGEGTKVH